MKEADVEACLLCQLSPLHRECIPDHQIKHGCKEAQPAAVPGVPESEGGQMKIDELLDLLERRDGNRDHSIAEVKLFAKQYYCMQQDLQSEPASGADQAKAVPDEGPKRHTLRCRDCGEYMAMIDAFPCMRCFLTPFHMECLESHYSKCFCPQRPVEVGGSKFGPTIAPRAIPEVSQEVVQEILYQVYRQAEVQLSLIHI